MTVLTPCLSIDNNKVAFWFVFCIVFAFVCEWVISDFIFTMSMLGLTRDNERARNRKKKENNSRVEEEYYVLRGFMYELNVKVMK